MTTVARVPRPGRHLWAYGAAATAGVALSLVILGVFVSLPDRGRPSTASSAAGVEATADREAFLAYEQAVDGAVQDGGFAVVHGMRPGVADISEAAFPDETLVTMASGWLATVERVRADLAAAQPPAFLVDSARSYDEALAAYVQVAEVLLAAAQATGVERAALVEEVPPLGRRADELWDAAQADLDRHRQRLGIDQLPAPTHADRSGTGTG